MKQNSIKVAITGGIGSGKSEVCKIIKELGYSVISCDEIYKELIFEKDFINKLTCAFGDILDINGYIDKKKLSAIVFNDNIKLQKLNSLTHPIIMDRALREMDGKNISFCEVPLLFEGGFEGLFDSVIVVLRDFTQRVASIRKRDNLSESEAKKRINSQFNYDFNNFEKYYVIHNDLDLSRLRGSTAEIIEKLVKNKH